VPERFHDGLESPFDAIGIERQAARAPPPGTIAT
jgi:hypothetical protein